MEDADLRRFGWMPGAGAMHCIDCGDLCAGAADEAFRCQVCAGWLCDEAKADEEATTRSGWMEAGA